MILGIIGGAARMEGTVMGDDVNVAARLQGLTKMFGATVLISEKTFRSLKTPLAYSARLIDHVSVRGRAELITVYEVFDGDPPAIKEAKQVTRESFETGVTLYNQQKFEEAEEVFVSCLGKNPHDRAIQLYLERCWNDRRGL